MVGVVSTGPRVLAISDSSLIVGEGLPASDVWRRKPEKGKPRTAFGLVFQTFPVRKMGNAEITFCSGCTCILRGFVDKYIQVRLAQGHFQYRVGLMGLIVDNRPRTISPRSIRHKILQ